MKLVAIMPVRNEDWVLGLSARAILRWADSLIVLDHASTDSTREIILDICREYPAQIVVAGDDKPEWREMEHRQALLEMARACEATHIATIDADEVLTANLVPDIRAMFAACPSGATLQLPWQCLRGSIDKVHQSGVWASQFASSGFVDHPAFHWAAQADGYQHHHRHPMGKPLMPWRPCGFSRGGLMHLQFVDDLRLKAKQYLYCLNDRLRRPKDRQTAQQVVDYYSPAVYGRWRGDGYPCALGDVPVNWWEGYEDLMPHLHLDRDPWQLTECRRIVRENPGIAVGLDHFGLELR